ncbi:SemiSWEET family sugar transporter [Flavobacterium noncentrifugens]|nr:SemiSWEET family transporter [Flavobacterium noncentrifugens]
MSPTSCLLLYPALFGCKYTTDFCKCKCFLEKNLIIRYWADCSGIVNALFPFQSVNCISDFANWINLHPKQSLFLSLTITEAMDSITIIGLGAALMTTISNIPQAYKIIKTKETNAVSAWSNIVLFIGLVVWVVYGFLRNDWPIIISNLISAIITAIVIFLKLTSKKVIEDIHDKVN